MPALSDRPAGSDPLDDLAAAVAPHADVPVRALAVGSHYAVVSSRGTGLAATGRPPSDDSAAGLQAHVGQPADRLLVLLGSNDPLDRSIGLAAVNSLVQVPVDVLARPDGRSLMLELGRGRRVALVGRFRFAPALADVAASLAILELEPRDGEHPASAAPSVLAGADVVGVTATTLVNGTFAGLVAHVAPGATVVMLGPSTPLHTVLFDHRVDVLAGLVVDDEAALVAAVGGGAGRHGLRGTRPVALARSRALRDAIGGRGD